MAKWGYSLIDEDHLARSTDLPGVLDAIQDLARLMELVMIGMEHDDPSPDDTALLHSLLWPLKSAAFRAAELERERRAASPSDPPPPGPLHVVREGGP